MKLAGLLTLIFITLLGCKPKMDKPFVIIDKSKYDNGYLFTYEDERGVEECFYEDTDKYNIGDTIK